MGWTHPRAEAPTSSSTREPLPSRPESGRRVLTCYPPLVSPSARPASCAFALLAAMASGCAAVTQGDWVSVRSSNVSFRERCVGSRLGLGGCTSDSRRSGAGRGGVMRAVVTRPNRRRTLAPHERVLDPQRWESAEIPVRGPQLRHAVEQTDARYPGVVNPGPDYPTLKKLLPQNRPVPTRLPDDLDPRRFGRWRCRCSRGVRRCGDA